MNSRPKKISWLDLAGTALILIIAIASYSRLYLGVDVTDEAQYVSEAYLPFIGGKPFYNELFIQQAASLLFSPLVWLYLKMTGSTFGIFLFVRHLYFAFAVLTAFSYFHILRPLTGKFQALAAASVFLSFIPYCVPSLSYNTIGYFGFSNFIIWNFSARHNKSTKAALIASTFGALAIFAYPTLMIPVGLYYFLAIATALTLCVPWKTQFYSAAFCGLLLAVTVPWLLLFGWENLVQSYTFSRSFGAGGGFEKLSVAFHLAQKFPLPWYLLLAIPAILGLIRLIRPLSWIWLPVSLVAAYFTCYFVNPSSHWPVLHTHVLIWYLALAMLFFIFNPRLRAPLGLIAFSSIAGGLVLMVSSTNTLYTAALATVGFLVLTWSLTTAPGWAKTVGLLIFNLGILAVSYSSYYRDSSFSHLTSRIPSGPYAGLVTSEARKSLLLSLQKDIQEAQNLGKSIFFYDSFPAGYLMSDLRPKTRTLFMHPIEYAPHVRELYAEYFAWPQNRPDIVFDFKFLDFNEGQRVKLNSVSAYGFKDPLRDFFLKTGQYRVFRSQESYDVLIKTAR